MLRFAHIQRASFRICAIDAVEQLAIMVSGQPRGVLLKPHCQACEPAIMHIIATSTPSERAELFVS